MSTQTSALQQLSDSLASAVERSSHAVVAVHGRERTPSSGVHLRKGVIVTTDHTLQQEQDITIGLATGTTLKATLAGRDPGTDIAVLRVAELDDPGVEFMDAAGLKAGHIVLAIGRGVNASLGIVSATGGPWRTWKGGSVDRLIRLDVSIYTGFSGGALVDSGGRIAGVNTSALQRGAGISLPLSTVQRVTEELLQKGRISRGYLGIGVQAVLLPEARLGPIGVSSPHGLIVLNVEANGPADRAGITLGDVLLTLNGTQLSDVDELQGTLTQETIGRKLLARILRGGGLIELEVVPADRPGRS